MRFWFRVYSYIIGMNKSRVYRETSNQILKREKRLLPLFQEKDQLFSQFSRSNNLNIKHHEIGFKSIVKQLTQPS